MVEDIHGDIPGHAASEGPAHKLQKFLASRGASFEAEGDTTRVHFNGWVLEVRDEPGGRFSALITINVPDTGPSEEARRAICEAFNVALSIKGRVTYEVEEYLPGYTMLRIAVTQESFESLVDDLIKVLDKYLP